MIYDWGVKQWPVFRELRLQAALIIGELIVGTMYTTHMFTINAKFAFHVLQISLFSKHVLLEEDSPDICM